MKTVTQIIGALLLVMSAPLYGDAAAVGGTWLSGDGDGLIAVRVDGTAISAQILGSPNKDPNSGKTYSCKLKLVDADTLKVRGYIGISLIGRTETWKRLAN